MRKSLGMVGEIGLGMTGNEIIWNSRGASRDTNFDLVVLGNPGLLVFPTYDIRLAYGNKSAGQDEGKLISMEIIYELNDFEVGLNDHVIKLISGHLVKFGPPEESFEGEGKWGKWSGEKFGYIGKAEYHVWRTSDITVVLRISEGHPEKPDMLSGDFLCREASKAVYYSRYADPYGYLRELGEMGARPVEFNPKTAQSISVIKDEEDQIPDIFQKRPIIGKKIPAIPLSYRGIPEHVDYPDKEPEFNPERETRNLPLVIVGLIVLGCICLIVVAFFDRPIP